MKNFFVFEGSIAFFGWLYLLISHEDFFTSSCRSLDAAVIDLLKAYKEPHLQPQPGQCPVQPFDSSSGSRRACSQENSS